MIMQDIRKEAPKTHNSEDSTTYDMNINPTPTKTYKGKNPTCGAEKPRQQNGSEPDPAQVCHLIWPRSGRQSRAGLDVRLWPDPGSDLCNRLLIRLSI